MTSKTDESSVAGGMWTTTQKTWHPKAGNDMGNNNKKQLPVLNYSLMKWLPVKLNSWAEVCKLFM